MISHIKSYRTSRYEVKIEYILYRVIDVMRIRLTKNMYCTFKDNDNWKKVIYNLVLISSYPLSNLIITELNLSISTFLISTIFSWNEKYPCIDVCACNVDTPWFNFSNKYYPITGNEIKCSKNMLYEIRNYYSIKQTNIRSSPGTFCLRLIVKI